jgi:hypothetical protein
MSPLFSYFQRRTSSTGRPLSVAVSTFSLGKQNVVGVFSSRGPLSVAVSTMSKLNVVVAFSPRGPRHMKTAKRGGVHILKEEIKSRRCFLTSSASPHEDR